MNTTMITPDEIRRYGIDADDDQINRVITDAYDQATLIAPSIPTLTGTPAAGVAAVIRVAVARYIETANNGSEGLTQTQDTAGPFSTSSSYRSRTTIFLPSEERKLTRIEQADQQRVHLIDLMPEPGAPKTTAEQLNAGQTRDAERISACNERIFRRDLDRT